jgi:RNA polymerase sporulation-specific sigma factor
VPDRQLTEWALKACDGDEIAFEALCRYFDGLLHAIAGEFYACGVTHDDLLQEARIALLASTVSFDPSRGVPFATFAATVVRRRVMSAVKSATRLRHSPLAQSRLEEPSGNGDRTLGDFLAASPFCDPVEVIEARDELHRVVNGLVATMSPLEATVLARILNGATLAQAGQGLGRSAQGSAKVADNALQRLRARGRRALGDVA